MVSHGYKCSQWCLCLPASLLQYRDVQYNNRLSVPMWNCAIKFVEVITRECQSITASMAFSWGRCQLSLTILIYLSCFFTRSGNELDGWTQHRDVFCRLSLDAFELTFMMAYDRYILFLTSALVDQNSHPRPCISSNKFTVIIAGDQNKLLMIHDARDAYTAWLQSVLMKIEYHNIIWLSVIRIEVIFARDVKRFPAL